MEVLEKFLEQDKSHRLKIAVVGDSMIDEYYAVRVNRISPEFPIPVLLSENQYPTSVVPGGAANVCCQMKHWNINVNLFTAFDKQIGDHSKFWESIDFKVEDSVLVNNWRMPVKKRFYDGDFPLQRWDCEIVWDYYEHGRLDWNEERDVLFTRFVRFLEDEKPDVVIISDYGKGMFIHEDNLSSRIIKECTHRGIFTIVDPKTLDIEFWKNCDIIKPNAAWTKAFCEKYGYHSKGEKKWVGEMRFVKEKIGCESVVLTDSGNGVGIYNGEDHFFTSPELSKRRPIIRSVIGAGDCFCAFLAMGLARTRCIQEAVVIAFNGANAYIEDKHNNPVTTYQFNKWFDPVGAKIVNINDVIQIKKSLPKQNWVWTNGAFDLLHFGHVKSLKLAAAEGDKLVVGLNTDESIKSLKGEKRPILNFKERAGVLSAIQHVDFVVPIENEESLLNSIKSLNPEVLIKGDEYKDKPITGSGYAGKVVLIPMEPGSSTTNIIEKVRNG